MKNGTQAVIWQSKTDAVELHLPMYGKKVKRFPLTLWNKEEYDILKKFKEIKDSRTIYGLVNIRNEIKGQDNVNPASYAKDIIYRTWEDEKKFDLEKEDCGKVIATLDKYNGQVINPPWLLIQLISRTGKACVWLREDAIKKQELE